MAKQVKKFDEQYNAAKYNEGVASSFEFGVDDSVKTYLETGVDGTSEYYHYSYWSNDNGEWCYVHHDTNGDYYAAVSLGDCTEIGLRVDVRKPVTLPKSAQLSILSYENGASVAVFYTLPAKYKHDQAWTEKAKWFVCACRVIEPTGRRQHARFEAVGEVRLLAHADVKAEHDRIREIDASLHRGRQEAIESVLAETLWLAKEMAAQLVWVVKEEAAKHAANAAEALARVEAQKRLNLSTPRRFFRKPEVPAGWAESRNCCPVVARAIFELADIVCVAPAAIWQDPTADEETTIREIVAEYLAFGDFEPSADHSYCWGWGPSLHVEEMKTVVEVEALA